MRRRKFEKQLMLALDRRAETWRKNTVDPHNINTAVYVALLEVAQAVADAGAQLDEQRTNEPSNPNAHSA